MKGTSQKNNKHVTTWHFPFPPRQSGGLSNFAIWCDLQRHWCHCRENCTTLAIVGGSSYHRPYIPAYLMANLPGHATELCILPLACSLLRPGKGIVARFTPPALPAEGIDHALDQGAVDARRGRPRASLCGLDDFHAACKNPVDIAHDAAMPVHEELASVFGGKTPDGYARLGRSRPARSSGPRQPSAAPCSTRGHRSPPAGSRQWRRSFREATAQPPRCATYGHYQTSRHELATLLSWRVLVIMREDS
jgi:hypothetical protein